MKKWIFFAAIVFLYAFLNYSFAARDIILEKDRIINDKETELKVAQERITELKNKELEYHHTFRELVLWARDLFPWGAGGALEFLTEIDLEDTNLEDAVKILPGSIPEADQRVFFLERVKKWPLIEYNLTFGPIGWGYPVPNPENSYVSEEFVKYYRVKANSRYFSGPHPGGDIVSPFESQAISVADGEVTFINIEPLFEDITDGHPLELYERGMGSYVVIEHTIPNNQKRYSVYGHLTEVIVKVGEKVKKGQPIGIMGSTGISQSRHLHFEIRKYITNNKYVRINPFTNSLHGNVVYTTFIDGKFE